MTVSKTYGAPRPPLENLVGKRFGRLLVLAEAPRCMSQYPQRRPWICACDCDGFIVRETNRLSSGQAKSCGCRGTEQATEAHKAKAKRKREAFRPDLIPENERPLDPMAFLFARPNTKQKSP